MNENSIKELINSFIEYRNLIAPLQDSLHQVSKTYEEITRKPRADRNLAEELKSMRIRARSTRRR